MILVENLFSEYINDLDYRAVWNLLESEDGIKPGMRGGHQMVINYFNSKIIEFTNFLISKISFQISFMSLEAGAVEKILLISGRIIVLITVGAVYLKTRLNAGDHLQDHVIKCVWTQETD